MEDQGLLPSVMALLSIPTKSHHNALLPRPKNSLEFRILPREAPELPINLPGGCTVQALSTGTSQLGIDDPHLSQFH